MLTAETSGILEKKVNLEILNVGKGGERGGQHGEIAKAGKEVDISVINKVTAMLTAETTGILKKKPTSKYPKPGKWWIWISR